MLTLALLVQSQPKWIWRSNTLLVVRFLYNCRWLLAIFDSFGPFLSVFSYCCHSLATFGKGYQIFDEVMLTLALLVQFKPKWIWRSNTLLVVRFLSNCWWLLAIFDSFGPFSSAFSYCCHSLAIFGKIYQISDEIDLSITCSDPAKMNMTVKYTSGGKILSNSRWFWLFLTVVGHICKLLATFTTLWQLLRRVSRFMIK